MTRVWAGFVALLLVVLVADVAQACSVCFSARDENRMAFIVTTGLMTGLPLGLIGGTVLWLRFRVRRLQRHLRARGG